MPDFLYDTVLQGVMVDLFIKTCASLGNAEYNHHDSLQVCLVEGIDHSII